VRIGRCRIAVGVKTKMREKSKPNY